MKKLTYFATLTLIHRVMLIGQILFLTVIFYLIYSKTLTAAMGDQVKALQVFALIFALAAIMASAKLFKTKLALIDQGENANQKLPKYRAAVLLQLGIAELPTLVSGICFLLSGNYAFLALAIVIVIYFAMLMPVKQRINAQLNLQPGDLDSL